MRPESAAGVSVSSAAAFDWASARVSRCPPKCMTTRVPPAGTVTENSANVPSVVAHEYTTVPARVGGVGAPGPQ